MHFSTPLAIFGVSLLRVRLSVAARLSSRFWNESGSVTSIASRTSSTLHWYCLVRNCGLIEMPEGSRTVFFVTSGGGAPVVSYEFALKTTE